MTTAPVCEISIYCDDLFSWLMKFVCNLFDKVPWLDAIYAILGAILFTMVRAKTRVLFLNRDCTTHPAKTQHKK